MPTYEYACNSCGEHLEIVQSFRDEPLTECPACGGPLRKVFSAIGVVFKGSGFYKTDSRPSGKSSSAAETKTDTKATTSSSDKAGDSSSASKSDSSTTSGSSSSTSSSGSSGGVAAAS